MKLSLAEPKYLKDSISIISDLVNEARFKITSNAVELVAMDPANVAMVVFKLLSSAFTEYDVKKDIELAINLSNLKQILRRAGPNDMLSLELEENKLKIQLKGHSTRTFGLPIIDLEEKEQTVPELKFNATIKLASNMLNSAVEDVDVNTPATIEPLGIGSDYINPFINEDELVEVEVGFDREVFCCLVKTNGSMGLEVIGFLVSGR